MKHVMKKENGVSSVAILIIVIIIAIILAIGYKIYDTLNKVELTLIGEEVVAIEVGNKYEDAGFIAKVKQKDLSDIVTIKTNLNTNAIGDYEIHYNLSLKYLFVNKTVTRKIKVVDIIKPELTVDGEKELITYIDEKFEYPSYTATDNYDGDITRNVIIDTNLDTTKTGKYEINYLVSDSSGNETTDTISVTVKDKKNPHIIVSISNQTLEYYEYGEVVLSSDVVTGINGKTPTGTFKVLNKAKNVTLKGADYESFVSYWIAFKGNSFGFHDASWRSRFGGNIYKTNGSHGCVNMPYNKVKKLYNMVEIGTPVYIKK